VEGSKKEALTQKERADRIQKEYINMAVQRTEQDSNYIKSLHEKDPDLANLVAKQFQKDD